MRNGLSQEPVPYAEQESNAGAGRIQFPTHGTILALDPDIPPLRQQLLLQASQAKVQWFRGDKPLGTGRQVHWQPWPGRHRLQLRDLQGNVLDEVALEVRGAGLTEP